VHDLSGAFAAGNAAASGTRRCGPPPPPLPPPLRRFPCPTCTPSLRALPKFAAQARRRGALRALAALVSEQTERSSISCCADRRLRQGALRGMSMRLPSVRTFRCAGTACGPCTRQPWRGRLALYCWMVQQAVPIPPGAVFRPCLPMLWHRRPRMWERQGVCWQCDVGFEGQMDGAVFQGPKVDTMSVSTRGS